MQELLELIIKNIVTNPTLVVISVSEEDGREVYTVAADPADMGRIIGKAGKVIKAIRTLAHVVAIRQGKRFRINLADDRGNLNVDSGVESEVATEVGTEATMVADVIDLTPEASAV